jgi:hypothetical protein
MILNTEQLRELEKKLASDLESVRRVIALNTNPDIARVSELLGEKIVKPTEPEMFKIENNTLPAIPTPSLGPIPRERIKQVILGFSGNFKFSDVVREIERQLPGRDFRQHLLAASLRQLREAGQIKEVIPRDGQNGATYAKV